MMENMGFRAFSFLWIWSVAAVCGGNASDSGLPWLWFEGRVDTAAPELAPVVRNGLVLSASWQWPPEEIERMSAPGLRYIWQGESTPFEANLDLNHVIVWSGNERSGEASLTRVTGEPDASGDFAEGWLHWIFPLHGETAGAEGWQPQWLEIWLPLAGREQAGNPDSSAYFETGWERGAFRVTFGQPVSGNQVFAEGFVTVFESLDRLPTIEEEREHLLGLVARMGQQLNDRDRELRELRQAHNEAQERIRGLFQTVDFLVAERARIESERDRIASTQAASNDVLLQQVAELEAGLAMAETARAEIEEENNLLVKGIADMLAEQQRLATERDQLRELLGGEFRQERSARETLQPGEVYITESPMQIEELAPPPPSGERPRMEEADSAQSEQQPVRNYGSTRRRLLR